MGLNIYPQLGTILAARRMTEDELARQIRERFNLDADATMVARLTRQDSLQNASIVLAIAASRILSVSLDDLFPCSDDSPSSAMTSGHLRRGYTLEEIVAMLDEQTYGGEVSGEVQSNS